MKKLAKTTICTAAALMLASAPVNAYAMAQDETVYAKLQPNGAISYTSVTRHLLNDERDARLIDNTTLSKIENLNGFENYAFEGTNLTWEANGKDIYYRGQVNQELPIGVAVTYKLNGEIKQLDEILGQAGKVEISLRYTNKAKVGSLYTPFVVAMATTLPEDTTHNLQVSNGKVMSNGKNLMVVAVAAPGLYESLQLEELHGLNEIILSFETERFELGDVYNIVTPKILAQEDLQIFEKVDELADSTQKLVDSSKELVDGAKELRFGVQDLRGAVVNARKQFRATGQLLDSDTLDQISATAASVARRKVAAQESAIRQQVHQQIISMTGLDQIQKTLGEQLTQAQALVACQKAGTSDCTDETVLNLYIEQVRPLVQEELNKQFDMGALEEKMAQSTLASMQQVAAETAATTARSVAVQVAESVQDGLNEGMDDLLGAMIKGIDQVLGGADRLATGMEKFDAEGIQTLNSFVNGKLYSTSNKIKRLMDLAEKYDNFAGIAEGVEGETKFVLMIDGKK